MLPMWVYLGWPPLHIKCIVLFVVWPLCTPDMLGWFLFQVWLLPSFFEQLVFVIHIMQIIQNIS